MFRRSQPEFTIQMKLLDGRGNILTQAEVSGNIQPADLCQVASVHLLRKWLILRSQLLGDPDIPDTFPEDWSK
jgi:hypothetical protein